MSNRAVSTSSIWMKNAELTVSFIVGPELELSLMVRVFQPFQILCLMKLKLAIFLA